MSSQDERERAREERDPFPTDEQRINTQNRRWPEPKTMPRDETKRPAATNKKPSLWASYEKEIDDSIREGTAIMWEEKLREMQIFRDDRIPLLVSKLLKKDLYTFGRDLEYILSQVERGKSNDILGVDITEFKKR